MKFVIALLFVVFFSSGNAETTKPVSTTVEPATTAAIDPNAPILSNIQYVNLLKKGEAEEVDVEEPPTTASSEGAGARAFIGLRNNYCYSSIGSGFMSKAKCSLYNPLRSRICPTRKCAYRPTFARFGRFYFQVVQRSWVQQSVGATMCRNPGQICNCRGKCDSCSNKRKTCQNVYGTEDHRLIIAIPVRDVNSVIHIRYVRLWTKVKVSTGCKCT